MDGTTFATGSIALAGTPACNRFHNDFRRCPTDQLNRRDNPMKFEVPQ